MSEYKMETNLKLPVTHSESVSMAAKTEPARVFEWTLESLTCIAKYPVYDVSDRQTVMGLSTAGMNWIRLCLPGI